MRPDRMIHSTLGSPDGPEVVSEAILPENPRLRGRLARADASPDTNTQPVEEESWDFTGPSCSSWA